MGVGGEDRDAPITIRQQSPKDQRRSPFRQLRPCPAGKTNIQAIKEAARKLQSCKGSAEQESQAINDCIIKGRVRHEDSGTFQTHTWGLQAMFGRKEHSGGSRVNWEPRAKCVPWDIELGTP